MGRPVVTRHVCYISGTRADFGLIESTLCLAARNPDLAVSVVATGMHLSPTYGLTVREIEASGLRLLGRVLVDVETATGPAMACALGQELIGFVSTFERERPDVVMVLGDRGEMLAGALAATHLGLPLVHIHGGELSGTVDEPIRHAISKLANYHFVATPGSRERLIRMGENPADIHVTGAPGLDGLLDLVRWTKLELCGLFGLDAARPVALVVFHPVLQEALDAGNQACAVMDSVLACEFQALCLMPNSDAGGNFIRHTLATYAEQAGVRIVTHLERALFVSWMAAADLMVGNSSSGIIEAASVGLPVVNVGERQRNRERSGNVVDAPPTVQAISQAIVQVAALPRRTWNNVYGDGHAGERIVTLLRELKLNERVFFKSNSY